jgi:hypothetical protein
MIRFSFKIPLYRVSVTLVQSDGDDSDEVKSLLKSHHIDTKEIDYITDGIKNGAMNGGNTFTNMDFKKVLCFFYKNENDKRRDGLYGHEKRHIEDRVMEYFIVNDIESAGMLAEYLSERFYDFKMIQQKL